MPVDFDKIYATDLVYVQGCWQLCGDAHCCSFSRYKRRFKLLGDSPEVEFLLLPGEYDYLKAHDWLKQFQEHDYRSFDYQFGDRRIRIESVISRRPGCACDHPTRPTVCRLYPLMPIFDLDGRVLGADRVWMYEVIEELEGLDRACQVTSVSFTELDKFLALAGEIGSDPRSLFYLSAYRIGKEHLRERLVELKGNRAKSYFQVFEANLLMNRLVDHERLGKRLSALADSFEEKYGPEFSLP